MNDRLLLALLSGYSAAALSVSTGQVGLWPALALGGITGSLVLWRVRVVEPISLPSDAADKWMTAIPSLLLLLSWWLFTYVTTPGADAAMYAAIGRALLDASPDLSAAYPNVRVAMYPRGFSLLVGLFTPVFGMGKACLCAALSSYLVYALALATWLRCFVPRRFALGFAVLLLFASRHPPLGMFSWGGNPTALAFGLALFAVCVSVRRGGWPLAALLIAGAFSTHPIGAISGCAVAPLAFFAVRPSVWRLALPFIVVAPVLLLFNLYGPALSEAERSWITTWQATSALVIRAEGRWLPFEYLSALSREVGDWLAVWFYVCAGAVIVFCRVHLNTLALSLGGLLYVALLMLLAPRLPTLGVFFYQDRLTLVWIPALAPLIAVVMHQLLLRPRMSPRVAASAGLVFALSLAAIVHTHRGISAPLMTRDDQTMMACVQRQVPPGEVIVADYNHGGQWLPAFTGRPITQPHVHCSLFDEMSAERKRMASHYQFVTDTPNEGDILCQVGESKLVRLQADVDAGPDPW